MLQNMKINKYLHIVLIIIVFTFGYIVSKIVNIPHFSIQKEINPIHLISILTTIFVAILISIIFDQHKERNKVGKGLFFDKIEDIYNILEKIHGLIETKKIDLSTATSSIKRLRSSIRFIFVALENKRIVATDHKNRIESILKDMNSAMTNTPIAETHSTANTPLSISDGVITYSQQRAAHISSQVEVLKNELFKLQMTINDA